MTPRHLVTTRPHGTSSSSGRTYFAADGQQPAGTVELVEEAQRHMTLVSTIRQMSDFRLKISTCPIFVSRISVRGSSISSLLTLVIYFCRFRIYLSTSPANFKIFRGNCPSDSAGRCPIPVNLDDSIITAEVAENVPTTTHPPNGLLCIGRC